MPGTRTLTIIKPDAFGSGKAGKIVAHLEQAGFRIVAARVMHLSQAEAEGFYLRMGARRIERLRKRQDARA